MREEKRVPKILACFLIAYVPRKTREIQLRQKASNKSCHQFYCGQFPAEKTKVGSFEELSQK
jgi:hypothetical protein